MTWRIFHRRKRLPTQLDRVESLLTDFKFLLDRLHKDHNHMSNQIDDLIQSLNTNTNIVSTRLDQLVAEILTAHADAVAAAAAASAAVPAGPVVTKSQMASLQAISEHLKTLGAFPSNPVPTVPTTVTAPSTPAPATEPTPSPVAAPAEPTAATGTATGTSSS